MNDKTKILIDIATSTYHNKIASKEEIIWKLLPTRYFEVDRVFQLPYCQIGGWIVVTEKR